MTASNMRVWWPKGVRNPPSKMKKKKAAVVQQDQHTSSLRIPPAAPVAPATAPAALHQVKEQQKNHSEAPIPREQLPSSRNHTGPLLQLHKRGPRVPRGAAHVPVLPQGPPLSQRVMTSRGGTMRAALEEPAPFIRGNATGLPVSKVAGHQYQSVRAAEAEIHAKQMKLEEWRANNLGGLSKRAALEAEIHAKEILLGQLDAKRRKLAGDVGGAASGAAAASLPLQKLSTGVAPVSRSQQLFSASSRAIAGHGQSGTQQAGQPGQSGMQGALPFVSKNHSRALVGELDSISKKAGARLFSSGVLGTTTTSKGGKGKATGAGQESWDLGDKNHGTSNPFM